MKIPPDWQERLRAYSSTLYEELRFGYFECGKGWYYELENMTAKLCKLEEDMGIEIKIRCVKQKFANLVVWYRAQKDGKPVRLSEIDLIIRETVESVQTVCEICGGTSVGGEPWKRLCKNCQNES